MKSIVGSLTGTTQNLVRNCSQWGQTRCRSTQVLLPLSSTARSSRFFSKRSETLRQLKPNTRPMPVRLFSTFPGWEAIRNKRNVGWPTLFSCGKPATDGTFTVFLLRENLAGTHGNGPGAPLLAFFARGGRVNALILGLRLLLAHAPAPCKKRKERGTQNLLFICRGLGHPALPSLRHHQ